MTNLNNANCFWTTQEEVINDEKYPIIVSATSSLSPVVLKDCRQMNKRASTNGDSADIPSLKTEHGNQSLNCLSHSLPQSNTSSCEMSNWVITTPPAYMSRHDV
tara:strand:- start:482 stop:793 length:312 start_codon:yes stop_codon:yes gene_type:complete